MARMTASPFVLGHLAMLTFSLLIAGSFSFGTRMANMMDPTTLTAIRFALAGALVGAAAALRPGIRAAHFRAPWRYLVLGGLFAFYFAMMFVGLKTADPVAASAVFTLTPAMTAVFGYVLLGQIITRRMALALAVGAFGAGWVIFRGDPQAALAFDLGRGEAIYLVACIAHALYTPMIRRLNRGEPAAVFTFGMIGAGFLLLGALTIRDLLTFDYAGLPPFFWIGLAYLAACSSALSFYLLQYATLVLPSANVMAYTYLAPTWVIAWEAAFGAALPAPVVWVGVAITVIALMMLLRQVRA